MSAANVTRLFRLPNNSSAVSRSAGPRQLRIDHQAVAIVHQYVALISQFCFTAHGLLKQSQIAAGSRLMHLIRAFLAVKFTVGFPGSSGLSSLLAQPSTIVPSTVKCSSESNSFVRANSSTAAKNSSAIAPRSNRSRFLLKVVAPKTSSSIFKPTNCETADCIPTAPSTFARCPPSKALAATARAATARARSTAARARVQLPKAWRQLFEDFIRHLAQRTQRVIRWHPLLRRHVTVHRRLLWFVSSHPVPPLARIIVDRDQLAGGMFSLSAAC